MLHSSLPWSGCFGSFDSGAFGLSLGGINKIRLENINVDSMDIYHEPRNLYVIWFLHTYN